MALERRHRVAHPSAGQPPAADLLGLSGLAHIDDAIELVVGWMRRLEVGRARGHVNVLAVDEPHGVHAARVFPGGVEMRDELGRLGLADVEQVETRGLHVDRARLVRDRHDIADHIQGIRAHFRVRQLGLHHHLEVLSDR